MSKRKIKKRNLSKSKAQAKIIHKRPDTPPISSEPWPLSKIKTPSSLLIIFIPIVFVIYSNTIKSPFVLDDIFHILQNQHIRLDKFTLNEFKEIFNCSSGKNRPVSMISFALNYYFSKYDVTRYHLTNIIIHIICGYLLFSLIKITLAISDRQSENQILPDKKEISTKAGSSEAGFRPFMIPFFAALIWLVHPVQTNSVTYVIQRMNSMAAMFYLLSLLLFIKGRLVWRQTASGLKTGADAKKKSGAAAGSFWYYTGCAAAGAMSLGCKETSAVLPFFIILYEWFFFQDMSLGCLKKTVTWVAALFFVILLILAAWHYGAYIQSFIRAGYKALDFTPSQRLLTEFRVVVYYISLLVFPHPSRLNLDYDFPVSSSIFHPPATFICTVVIAGLFFTALAAAKKERIISFCILWFLGNLVMESSFIPLDIIFEHRLYLPSMFFMLLPVILAEKIFQTGRFRVFALSVLIVILSCWTYQRNRVWRSYETIWRDCVKKSPGKDRPHNNLGLVLSAKGRLAEAAGQYLKALQINPDNHTAHFNLGTIFAKQRKFKKAAEHYMKALQIKPNYQAAHNNLGNALLMQNRLTEAKKHYLEVLRINPKNYKAYYNLGNLFFRQNRFKEAAGYYIKALRLKPYFINANYRLGIALMRQGKMEAAEKNFTAVLQLQPNHLQARNYRKRVRELMRSER